MFDREHSRVGFALANKKNINFDNIINPYENRNYREESVTEDTMFRIENPTDNDEANAKSTLDNML